MSGASCELLGASWKLLGASCALLVPVGAQLVWAGSQLVWAGSRFLRSYVENVRHSRAGAPFLWNFRPKRGVLHLGGTGTESATTILMSKYDPNYSTVELFKLINYFTI